MAGKKKAKKAAKKSKLPRQEVLPGVGDKKIAAIENAALDYAEIRDQRMELSTQEVDLKKKLLDLMHAKKLKEYKRNGISVIIKHEEETVKVRVKAEEDLDSEEPSQASEESAPEPEETEEDFEQEEGEDALIDAEVEEEEVPE